MKNNIEKGLIKKIINNSGHSFHLEIKELLENKGWIVDISQYYTDPITRIPREIDIIAEKNFKTVRDLPPNLTIRLLIECKYINQYSVFWFSEKNIGKAKKLAKNNLILRDKQDDYLTLDNKTHHYIKNDEVAKELSTECDKRSFDKAINQVLNATLSFSKNQTTCNYIVNFPIIIVNSFEKFKRKSDSPKDYDPITNNFEMEIEYTDHGKPEYFLIDIIAKDKIDDFFDYISNNDISILQKTLYWDIKKRKDKKTKNNNFNRYR